MSDLIHIDACDLLCPLPVLRLRKALEALPAGAEVELLANDAVAAIDVPHFCTEQGHVLLAARDEKDGVIHFRIRKAG